MNFFIILIQKKMSFKKHKISHEKSALPETSNFENNEEKQMELKEIELWRNEFNKNPVNVIARNAITSVGVMFSTANTTRVNNLSHVFMHSIKLPHIKATDQGMTGRCWMFAGLNMFRHTLMKALKIHNFEFSETYLFFWDKFERANTYLQYFIDNPVIDVTSREFDHIVDFHTADGGWWNMFSNLVKKYGLIPKNIMKETYQSVDSDDMNAILKEHLDVSAFKIMNKQGVFPLKKLYEIKRETMKEIYFTLIKFLGEPPNKFDWSFYKTSDDSDDENEHIPAKLVNLTPKMFADITFANKIDIENDFVVLCHIPISTCKTDTFYELKHTKNVYEGKNCKLFNTSIENLAKYSMMSIVEGLGVWFACDVSKNFNWLYSALDDELDDKNLIFNLNGKRFGKGERLIFKTLTSNHAMTLIGMNIDNKESPTEWQVENSWGYVDNEVPGQDGFILMKHSWFRKNVTQATIYKPLLSKQMLKIMEKAETIKVEPWENVSKMTMTK